MYRPDSGMLVSTLKPLFYLPFCLAIAACGGGGGGGGSDAPSGPASPTNTAPIANNDSVSVSARETSIVIDVLANDSDADGDALSLTAVESSEFGTDPAIEGDKIRYTLKNGVHGTDRFSYTISDGADESQATVIINIDSLLTLSGTIGESVSGIGTVTVTVGTREYQANLDGRRFQLELPVEDDSALVAVQSEHQNTDINKGIRLKSYLGTLGFLKSQANDGIVTEDTLPTLYLSAAGTSASAYMEMVAGGEIHSLDVLTNSAQTLPQKLVMESAIALKSLLAGDQWSEFTQLNTYDFLIDHPKAVTLAEQLEASNPEKYTTYRNQILSNSKQIKALETAPEQELLFIDLGDLSATRATGISVQLPAAESEFGYYATNSTKSQQDNRVQMHVAGNTISIDVDGVLDAVYFYDGREECTTPEVISYTATPIKTVLSKVLDTSVFSTYQQTTQYRCDETKAIFAAAPNFLQLNNVKFGDFSAATQNTFAIGTYLDKDETIYQGPYHWQAVLVSPNANGTITQRFDFKNDYTDSGVMSLDENGRLVLAMNRGITVEYVALGTQGHGLRTLGVVRRADGSIASVGGDYLVPVTQGLRLPVPGSLVIKDQQFAVLDEASKYSASGFGFEFFADGTGSQLYRSNGTYRSAISGYQWTEDTGYLDMRYFHHRSDNSDPYPSNCAEDDPDCVEYRYREIEPLAQVGGDYFVRIYQEIDYSKQYGTGEGEEVFISSYIDRFTPTP